MDELAAENEQLKDAIRRLAEQDATLSVCHGNVTVQIDAAEWVPVSERLPECEVHVLAWDSREGCERIAYMDGTWYMVGFDDDTAICVSHWMPLPEPPEVK